MNTHTKSRGYFPAVNFFFKIKKIEASPLKDKCVFVWGKGGYVYDI